MKTPGRLRHPLAVVVFAVSVLAAALPYALKLGADRDLWWHVRTGQMILEQRGLPDEDPFSFTAPQAQWTNHEWLSDIAVAVVYDLGGDSALLVWRVALLVSFMTVFALALRNRFEHPAFLLAALLLTAPLIRIFITLRPHAFTYLGSLLLILLFDASTRRPRLLWLLPPLMLVWANLHGGFLFGLGLTAIGLAIHGLGIEHGSCRRTRADRRRAAIVAGLALAAPVVNPHGLALFPYLARELGAEHSVILEWHGIWEFPEYRVPFVLLLLVPLIILAAGVIGRHRSRNASRFAGWLPRGALLPLAGFVVGACSTLRHGRFLILLVLFSALVTFAAIPWCLKRATRGRSFPLLEALRSPRWIAVLAGVPFLAGLAQFGVDYHRKGLRIEILGLPVLATEFLQRYDLGPNLALRLDWGGYAIWHLFPDYKVSADGRNLTVYDEALVTEHLEAYHSGKFVEHFRGQDVDAILVDSAGPAYEELRGNRRWTQVYEDRISAVFVRPQIARTLSERTRETRSRQPASERFYFP